VFIQKFSITESTIDKFIEAIKSGPYFPNSLIYSVGLGPDVFQRMSDRIYHKEGTWWEFDILEQLKKYPYFVDYIGRKHLPEPKGQNVVIYIMSKMDSTRAMGMFFGLNPNTLSRESLIILSNSLFPDDNKKETSDCEEARYLLLKYLLGIASTDTRKLLELTHFINYVSPEHQKYIIIGYFQLMTKDEQKDMIIKASMLDSVMRDKIYDEIKVYCDNDLKDFIEFCQKKDSAK
jgi:hypothetical protein